MNIYKNQKIIKKMCVIFTSGYTKNLFFIVLVFFVGFIPHVLAASGFTALAPIPGLTDAPSTAGLTQETLANFFNNLYKFIIGISATIAVVQIIWAGIDIAMNRDDVSKLMDEKGKIYNAIFGLVLVLSPALVFGIINPNILNMSIALPPLDTQWTSPITPIGGDSVPKTSSGLLSRFYVCGKQGDCTIAKNRCSRDPQAASLLKSQQPIKCLRSDGSVDSNGRTWTSRLPFTNRGCKKGETLNVACVLK